MHAGRLGRDEQLGGDVAVAAPGGDQAQHFPFAFGEPERRGRGGLLPHRGQVDAGPPGQLADLLEQRAGAELAREFSRWPEPDGGAVPVPGR